MGTHSTWLQHRSLTAIQYDEATDEWLFDFDDDYVLQVASPWRLVTAGTIAVGHCDHGHRFGLPEPLDVPSAVMEALKDRSVVAITIADATADLSIDFGAGTRLEIFNNSSGYEGWALAAPGNRLIVAQGGGNLAT
jgi:hypothetical protein